MSPDASSAVVDGAPHAGSRGALVWVLALVPLVLLGALLALIVGLGPVAPDSRQRRAARRASGDHASRS